MLIPTYLPIFENNPPISFARSPNKFLVVLPNQQEYDQSLQQFISYRQ